MKHTGGYIKSNELAYLDTTRYITADALNRLQLGYASFTPYPLPHCVVIRVDKKQEQRHASVEEVREFFKTLIDKQGSQ